MIASHSVSSFLSCLRSGCGIASSLDSNATHGSFVIVVVRCELVPKATATTRTTVPASAKMACQLNSSVFWPVHVPAASYRPMSWRLDRPGTS